MPFHDAQTAVSCINITHRLDLSDAQAAVKMAEKAENTCGTSTHLPYVLSVRLLPLFLETSRLPPHIIILVSIGQGGSLLMLRLPFHLLLVHLNLHFVRGAGHVLARAQLDNLSQAGLAGEQEVDTLQRSASGFRIPEPDDQDAGPVEDAEHNVELPANIGNTDRGNLHDQKGDQPLPDNR